MDTVLIRSDVNLHMVFMNSKKIVKLIANTKLKSAEDSYKKDFVLMEIAAILYIPILARQFGADCLIVNY